MMPESFVLLCRQLQNFVSICL